jgi:hypothetical protein
MRPMQRSAGVTVIATFALLGSLFCLPITLLMALRVAAQSRAETEVPDAKVGMAFAAIILLVPAVWGIATSIGLFRVKRWARISTLIFAGLLTFMGVVTPLFVMAIPMPPQANVTPAMMSAVKGAIAGFYLMLAAVGVWWLVYFTRPGVKAQFETGGVPRPPSARPLSISIIGWFCVVTCCCVPLNIVLRFPVILFGGVFSGGVAALIHLLFGIVLAVIAFGLLRLKSYAPALTIGYIVFGVLNAVVSFALPGSGERVQRLIDAMPSYFSHAQFQQPFNPFSVGVLMIPLWLIPIYFVVKNKKAFERPGPPEAPPMISEASS